MDGELLKDGTVGRPKQCVEVASCLYVWLHTYSYFRCYMQPRRLSPGCCRRGSSGLKQLQRPLWRQYAAFPAGAALQRTRRPLDSRNHVPWLGRYNTSSSCARRLRPTTTTCAHGTGPGPLRQRRLRKLPAANTTTAELHKALSGRTAANLHRRCWHGVGGGGDLGRSISGISAFCFLQSCFSAAAAAE